MALNGMPNPPGRHVTTKVKVYTPGGQTKFLAVLGTPAGAFVSPQKAFLEFWEYVISEYCHICPFSVTTLPICHGQDDRMDREIIS